MQFERLQNTDKEDSFRIHTSNEEFKLLFTAAQSRIAYRQKSGLEPFWMDMEITKFKDASYSVPISARGSQLSDIAILLEDFSEMQVGDTASTLEGRKKAMDLARVVRQEVEVQTFIDELNQLPTAF